MFILQVLKLIRGQADIEEEFYSIKQNCDEIDEDTEAKSKLYNTELWNKHCPIFTEPSWQITV